MYYIYDTATSRILGRGYGDNWKTEAAAKAAMTRMRKKGEDVSGLAIADSLTYHANIEKQVTRRNMMTGKTFSESVNTPNYCSPASEAYWSM